MSHIAKGSPPGVFSKPTKKRGEPYIFEKGLYKKIYNPSNSQGSPTVTVVCQMKNCNKRFENQKIKHSTSNYLRHYRRSHKSMNIDLLLKEQIEDPFNFHLLYQSGPVTDQFETLRSIESPHSINKFSVKSTQNLAQSDIIYTRSDVNPESSPSEKTHSHSSSIQSNQYPPITSPSQYLDQTENEKLRLNQLEKSNSISGKRKESIGKISKENTNGKIRKLIPETEYLSFETSEDALLAARDLIIHAYGLTTERTEQGKILDLLQIFRQYTENGHFNKESYLTTRKMSSFENTTRKIDTTDRDTNQSLVPQSINFPSIDKELPLTPIPHYCSSNTSETQELTILEKRNLNLE
ncbi:hypothetical protein OnM2_080045 [Erysiphe neolycopersici]|uniref:Uncharacterized protein n=1 Tax=Erysiphe neolycopersici TaxID=212602 RepID=A0A420HGL0_9PEZI|nr:hypothetical protein OnM2_080045 [Erysiphe neolycopersici]